MLIVDDSAFMRKLLTDILKSEPSIDVVGTARNGIDALKKIRELRPDVVTLDIEMPVMDGLTTLQRIMQEYPLPVIIVSSLTQKDAEITIQALQQGAVDFIAKPSGKISSFFADVKEELVSKIKTAASIDISKAVAPSPLPTFTKPLYNSNVSFSSNVQKQTKKKLVLIGTSTGGPQALQAVLPKLPKNIPAAILIVQHMPAGFTKSLANRLDQISEIYVKEAEDGEPAVDGTAYIAPGDYHMVIEPSQDKELLLRLTKEEPVNGHRPSVDVLMKSAAKIDGCELIGVIMTGMGYDGREGVRALKEKGAKVIAQDASTSVVFGMPKAIIEAKLADYIVPLPLIGHEIRRLVEQKEN
ncbi:MAG: protein-glutamate methylesterase/protein-glutamine glutaminase [Thermacetogeniaceae bacterium]